MPTPVTESGEGGQRVEWSETFHAFLFRARIYLKRFWWILIFTLAAGVLVQAWKKHTSVTLWTSHAEMMVQMVSDPTTTGAAYQENLVNFFQTQVHIMESAEVMDKANEKVCALHPTQFDLKSHPGVNAGAELITGTSILQLDATGPDPVYTQLFLDQWMQTYNEKKKQMRIDAIDERKTSIRETALDFQQALDQAQADESTYLEKNVIGTVTSEIESATAKLNALRSQISTLQAQLRVLGWTPDAPPDAPEVPLTEMDKFKQYIAGGDVEQVDGELASENLLGPNPEYELDKQSLVTLQVQENELAEGLGEHHPKMVALKTKISDLQNSLRQWRTKRVDALVDRKVGLLTDLQQALEDQKVENSQVLDDQKKQATYNQLDRQVQTNDKIYEDLIESQTSLQESKEMGQDMLHVNLDATPATPITESAVKQIGSGAFVGLAAGIAIIFLLGALDGRVMSVEDLTQRFDEPMLGVIPMQKRVAGQVELLKNNDQRQMFAESCRNIRSSLLYMDRQGQRPSVIMLTSSMPSEGKSTLSANLSITLGFASSKTLLVDADMRRGQLHKRFGIKNDFGLAEHIQDGLPLEKVIHKTNFENLDFIPCGQYPSQPGELLMSERFRESIATLRQKYDFVIFDSPPILLTDDAASFATRADAVLFVVRAGYTRMRQVRTSLEALNRRGVNVYGLIVNFIDHREPGYYSYRYYDYYSYRPSRTEKT
jgi:succinoglycan biosynthesis transport protein ExoP